MKLVKQTFVMGILLCLCACGGGGGGSKVSSTVVKGVAQAGVFVGATVQVFGYDASGNLVQLTTTPATVTTDASGNYQADIGSYTGAVLVKVFGTYHDEATNTDITIPAASALQGAMANASGTVNLPVTALTDLAVRKAQDAGGIKDNIAVANQAIGSLFGFDIVATTPVAPSASALGAAGVSDDQKKYTTALAALSQYVATSSATPAAPTAADLQNALSQISAGISAGGQVTSSQVAFGLQQAAAALAGNANTQAVVTAAGTAGQSALSTVETVGNATGSKILAVRLKTVGSFSGSIIGATARVTLPGSATLRADASGVALAGSVVASGLASGGTIAAKVSAGVLTIGIIPNTTTGAGFGIGEFATIYLDVPAASALTAADLNPVTNVTTKDVNGATINGITMAAF